MSEADIDAADLVLVYYWLQIDQLSRLKRAFEPRARPAHDRRLQRVRARRRVAQAGAGDALEAAAGGVRQQPQTRKQLEATLGREVFYTPNGVDTSFFRPAPAPPPSAPLRVGWAGSLKNQAAVHRGVHEFIAPAVAAVEGAELCLAAREDRWRNAEEMREFYQSLHVYVCASRSEGTPNPCLEAAACGLPVVTTPVGNMPELIRDGENGLFVARDVDDIAAKLRRLRDDPELRERMGRAARAAVEAWDWRHQAPRYAQMFEAVLDGRLPLRPSRARAAERSPVRESGASARASCRRSGGVRAKSGYCASRESCA